MPRITLDNISFAYKKKKQNIEVLKGFSCEFESNKVNVIIGASGAGKTTLLKILTGVIDPQEGNILFDDIDVTGYSVRDRNISLVNQNIILYPHLSVFKNIAAPLTFTDAGAEEIKTRVTKLAEDLGIEILLNRKPREISIGQAQRVAIARAIIKNPDLYLFDEPFSNVDEETTASLIYELKSIFNKLSATAIFITHSLKEAMAIGDIIYVLDDGKIIDKMPASELMDSNNPKTKELVKNEFGKVL